MEKNRKTLGAFRRENAGFITGKTVVDHKIRQQNDLTFREYVMLDTIMKIREGPQKRNPITYGNYWKECGIEPHQILLGFATLKEKGWLFKDEQGLIQVSEKFKDLFKTGSNFEEFWKIAPKGGKIGAHKMYDKAIRIKKHDELSQKYKEYIEYCDVEGRFRLDTSTWLNPKSGYIDTDWVAANVKKETQTKNPNSAQADEDFFKK